jgi:hypothetical protein
MAEVMRNAGRIVAIIRKLEAASATEHMRMHLRFDGWVMPYCSSIAVRCGSAPQWICGEL